MNKELKPLICTQCGGQIDRARMICPYCGTKFKEDENRVLRVETFSNPVMTYQASIKVPEFCFLREEQEAQNFVIRELTQQLSKAIAGSMEIESEKNPFNMTRTVRARVRIVHPMHRF